MTRSTFRGYGLVALFSALTLGTPRFAAAQNDPAQQFSPTMNPNPVVNGIWSYGYENFPIPNAFNLLTLPGPVSGLDAWRAPAFGEVGVFHNGTAAAVNYVQPGVDNAIYQGGEIGMHPGPNDQYAVIQFTVPTAGLYKIHGTFEGLDTTNMTNTLVALLVNNVPVATGNVIGDGVPSDVPLTFGPISLPANSTLAFATGGNPFAGSTGLLPGAAVDAVPEPGAMLLFAAGAMMCVVRARRVRG